MDGAGIGAIESMREGAFLGLMVGSAIVSPILVDAPPVWYKLDIFIFILSCGGFSFQHRENIKKYGPYTIPIATLLGLAAYSSARTPLGELVPWIPIAISLFLLMTSYSLPRFSSNDEDYIPLHQQSSLEDGLSRSAYGSSVATLGSRRQTGAAHEIRNRTPLVADLCEQCDRDYQVAHMSRSTSRLSQLPSVHESDIDLNESMPYLTQQWVSRLASLLPNGPRTDLELQTAGVLTGPNYHCRCCHGDFERPSTPGTSGAQCPSESARSESPLLGLVPQIPSGDHSQESGLHSEVTTLEPS